MDEPIYPVYLKALPADHVADSVLEVSYLGDELGLLPIHRRSKGAQDFGLILADETHCGQGK